MYYVNKPSNMVTEICNDRYISGSYINRTQRIVSENFQTIIPDSSMSVISNLDRVFEKF